MPSVISPCIWRGMFASGLFLRWAGVRITGTGTANSTRVEGFTAAQLAGKLRDTVEGATTIIAGLSTAQLTRTYTIQNYEVSGVEAVFHVVEHFSMHTGQIIFATKMLTGTDLGFYRHLRVRPAL